VRTVLLDGLLTVLLAILLVWLRGRGGRRRVLGPSGTVPIPQQPGGLRILIPAGRVRHVHHRGAYDWGRHGSLTTDKPWRYRKKPEPSLNVTSELLRGAPIGEQLEIAILIVWAMVLGALVGIERERASKASGVRTHMLVAGAAALVAAISSLLTGDGIGDQSRGIHGVITGIGFLGAGAILQSKKGGVITGMTTAASIFFTAAIGCAVAVGYAVTASIMTILGVGTLYGMGYFFYRHPVRGSMREKMLNDDHGDHRGDDRHD